jgi:hypothetical protein
MTRRRARSGKSNREGGNRGSSVELFMNSGQRLWRSKEGSVGLEQTLARDGAQGVCMQARGGACACRGGSGFMIRRREWSERPEAGVGCRARACQERRARWRLRVARRLRCTSWKDMLSGELARLQGVVEDQ